MLNKILIFKSTVTGAVYSWNGKQVVCIVGAEHRPVGKIMNGIPNEALQQVWKNKYAIYINLDGLTRAYEIIQRISLNTKKRKPKTISELEKDDLKMYEYFLRCRLKYGSTFKSFVNEYYK